MSISFILQKDADMRIVCFLASLEDDAYEVLRNIMDMFELGEIKGQIVKKLISSVCPISPKRRTYFVR